MIKSSFFILVYTTILISHYVSCQTFGQKMGQLAVNFGDLGKNWFKNFVDFKGSKVPITVLSDYQNDRKEFPAEDEVFLVEFKSDYVKQTFGCEHPFLYSYKGLKRDKVGGVAVKQVAGSYTSDIFSTKHETKGITNRLTQQHYIKSICSSDKGKKRMKLLDESPGETTKYSFNLIDGEYVYVLIPYSKKEGHITFLALTVAKIKPQICDNTVGSICIMEKGNYAEIDLSKASACIEFANSLNNDSCKCHHCRKGKKIGSCENTVGNMLTGRKDTENCKKFIKSCIAKSFTRAEKFPFTLKDIDNLTVSGDSNKKLMSEVGDAVSVNLSNVLNGLKNDFLNALNANSFSCPVGDVKFSSVAKDYSQFCELYKKSNSWQSLSSQIDNNCKK